MKALIPALVVAPLLLTAGAAAAQISGTSHPEAIEETITTTSVTTVDAKAQPATAASSSTFAAPVPRPASAPVPQNRVAVSAPDNSVPVLAEAGTAVAPASGTELRTADPRNEEARHEARRLAERDPDAGIVTEAPYRQNALTEGTVIRARLTAELSSKTVQPGTRFTARLSEQVLHDGRVALPEGTLLSGRVTAVHPGHRIGSAASMHLEPETVTLPDGTAYRMNARVIDLSDLYNSRVTNEGTLVRNQHTKGTLAALGLTTASAAAAGALLGGGIGAAVGAGVGIGVGTAFWLRRDKSEALDEGTQLVFSLNRPLELTPISGSSPNLTTGR